MIIPILAGAAVIAAALFLVMVFVATRRSTQIADLERALDEQQSKVLQAESRHADKCKQTEELRGKLDRAKDDAKRAKKKAYDRNREEKSADPDAAQTAEREQEEALLDAKAEAKRQKELTEQAAEAATDARAQAEKLKTENGELKTKLESAEEQKIKAARGESGKLGETSKKLAKLKEKLATAERRLKTDAQVYRVTNSKLELAMEKVAMLEGMLAKAQAKAEKPVE
jgi:hypothetical protein